DDIFQFDKLKCHDDFFRVFSENESSTSNFRLVTSTIRSFCEPAYRALLLPEHWTLAQPLAQTPRKITPWSVASTTGRTLNSHKDNLGRGQEEFSRCQTIVTLLVGTELSMKNGTLRNCTYRYSSHDSITSIALWIDGPCTCIAAILALIGVHFAVRFLFRAGLNKDLTAALFSLCVIDSLLMMTVFLFYCIEAIGVLFLNTNLMYNRQLFTSSLHGVAQSLTTASTMLVIYITFLRFMVVMRPLRYASSHQSARSKRAFTRYKAILMTLTQTVGPVATILILSVLTEYRVHRSLKKRRKLFESQQRSRSVVLTEESKEKVSRTVAIFIAVKFLIFRSMPVFFDVYENLYGIESFGVALSILVRISDFMIVLNSATNSLAYFGKKRWLEKRLRLRLLKRDEKRLEKAMRRASQISQQLSQTGSPKNGVRTHIRVTHHHSADYCPLMGKD
ncbi:hypothetical protein TELCIR_06451, partial [Teladorsagia circumcincta]